MFSPEQSALDQAVKDMHSSPRKFRIKDMGDIKEFFGILVNHRDNGSITLTQPQLIDSILHDLNFQDNTKVKRCQICPQSFCKRMLWVNHSTMTSTIEPSLVNLISWRIPPGQRFHMQYINVHISQKDLKVLMVCCEMVGEIFD